MPNLASSDVTLTVDAATKAIGEKNRRICNVTLAFGDGAKTYPANGVPLPAKGNFGMPRGNIESLDIFDAGGSLAILSYDKTHHTIRMVHPTQQTAGTGNRDGVEYASGTDAVAAQTLKARVVGF